MPLDYTSPAFVFVRRPARQSGPLHPPEHAGAPQWVLIAAYRSNEECCIDSMGHVIVFHNKKG